MKSLKHPKWAQTCFSGVLGDQTMKKLLLATAIAVALTGAAQARDQWPYMGIGTEGCGKFAQAYGQGGDEIELVYFTWAQGFMSAINGVAKLTGHSQKDLNAVPDSEQKASIRRYCNKHPLDHYFMALFPLLKSFPDLPEDKQDNQDN
jgi:hypothetical protein